MEERNGKVRLQNLREKNAFYKYFWEKGQPRDRRLVWVDMKDYLAFKKKSKGNSARNAFLTSGS